MLYSYLEDCRRSEEKWEDSPAIISEISGIILRNAHILKEYPELTFQQLFNGLNRQENLSPPVMESMKEWRESYETKGLSWIRINSAGAFKENEMILPIKDTASLVFSPDGNQIITGDNKGIIREWSLLWGEIVREIPLFDEPVEWLGYSPEGGYLVTSDKGSITFLKLPQMIEEKRFSFYRNHLIPSFYGGG